MIVYGVIYELHIEFTKINPTVWRKVHMHREATLHDLHRVIQLTFDWWDVYPFCFYDSDRKEVYSSPNHSQMNYRTTSNIKRSKQACEVKLSHCFINKNSQIEYIYKSPNECAVFITLHKIVKPMTKDKLYPVVVAAGNELIDHHNKIESVQFPFGRQQALQHKNLVKRLNKKLTYNLLQFSVNDREHYTKYCWDHLYEMTKKYYGHKPWKYISNEQVFAIYDERHDEYLFCSILGNNHDLYGLSVYIGYSGLLSLHTSLTKKLSMEYLFQLHSNLLLRFERNKLKNSKPEVKSGPFTYENGLTAHFTSYRPGYYPWDIDEKEAMMFSLAIEETLLLVKSCKEKGSIPNYIEKDCFLFITKDKENKRNLSLLTFEEMVKKIIPSQLALLNEDLQRIETMERHKDFTIEFSLQYVNVPIQRLKGNRPFLPLSSVIANHHTGTIIYHNIYDDWLNYNFVQAEFLHIFNIIEHMPSLILTDELTYHYLKPLLTKINLPIKVEKQLSVTDNINDSLSQYLLSKV